MIFLDTSALLAVLDDDDPRHPAADAAWKTMIEASEALVTSNYVVVEIIAVVQRRFGMQAVHQIQRDLLPLVSIEWLDPATHESAMAAFLQASRRCLSFVDCTSFEVMRQRSLTRAFALDGHFAEHGFEQIP